MGISFGLLGTFLFGQVAWNLLLLKARGCAGGRGWKCTAAPVQWGFDPCILAEGSHVFFLLLCVCVCVCVCG